MVRERRPGCGRRMTPTKKNLVCGKAMDCLCHHSARVRPLLCPPLPHFCHANLHCTSNNNNSTYHHALLYSCVARGRWATMAAPAIERARVFVE